MRSTCPHLGPPDQPQSGIERTMPDEDWDANPLVTAMRAVFSDPNYRPPALPRVALELHTLSRRPDASVKEIVHVLESDPILVGTLMKRAKSAVYSPGQPPRSVHEAVVRLGMRTTSDLFFEAAMKMRIFKCPAYADPMERVLRHSTAVAHFAQLIAKRTSICEDYAFFYGLMHDVGAAACMLALVEYGEQMPTYDEAWPAIEHVHAEASGMLATAWGLPEDVAEILFTHHENGVGDETNQAVAVLVLAERFANIHGFAADASSSEECSWAVAALNLPGLLKLEQEAESLGEKLRGET